MLEEHKNLSITRLRLMIYEFFSCSTKWFISLYTVTKSMCALWLVNHLRFIVPVNPWKNRVSSKLLYKSNRPQVFMVFRVINHLGILLVFYQHPAWFLGLQTIKTCGLLLLYNNSEDAWVFRGFTGRTTTADWPIRARALIWLLYNITEPLRALSLVDRRV